MESQSLDTLPKGIIYTVTLEHLIDGEVVATKSADVQSDSEDNASKTALDIASSSQGGMFNVFRKGNHKLRVKEVKSS